MKIYDITATIGDKLPVYGNERPDIKKTATLQNGDGYNLTKFTFTTHTGTHADMPSHFVESNLTCDTIPLDHFYGLAQLIRINATEHITKEILNRYEIRINCILLIDTGQSKFMGDPTLKKDFIAFTPCAAEYLVEKKIKTLGMDYLSVDPYDTTDYPVHKTLLGNGITILEGLVLENVPEGFYTISALPLKFEDGDGSPVRAVLVENTECEC